MNVVQVYRIDKLSSKGNSHTIDRSETWSIVVDRTFTSLEEAENYVIKQNRHNCAVDLGLNALEITPAIVRDKCLDNPKTIHLRTHFIGIPPLAEIRKSLIENKIHVDVKKQ